MEAQPSTKPQEPKGWHSRGYLPHFDSPETVQHEIMRSIGSLPETLVKHLPDDVIQRTKIIERTLDAGEGPAPFLAPCNAEIVEDALLHFDGQRYQLLVWCIMPNHIHVLLQQVEGFRLGQLVHSWKTFSARQINRLGHGKGPVWVPDYYDRFIRNQDHLAATVGYVERNPVMARLCEAPADWKFSSARLRPAGTARFKRALERRWMVQVRQD